MKKRVAIVGGGASGVLCAILLSDKFDVTIYERQKSILKKVLQSGNGMCNLTNEALSDVNNLNKKYNVDISDIIKEFDLNKLKDTFKDLGLIIRKDNEGRYYPYSKKASTVYDILVRALDEKNVKILTDVCINDIKYDDTFLLNNFYKADYLIISTGSKSGVNFKYNMYDVIAGLGLNISKLSPGLVGFKVCENVNALSGIRIKASVKMYVNNKLIDDNFGEVQFKDDGISGIVIMEESRFYDSSKKCNVLLDFMYDYSEDELINLIDSMYAKYHNYEDALIGILPKYLVKNILSRASETHEIAHVIKNYVLNIKDTYGFENSQVTKGGVSLNEVYLNTLEVKNIYNLFFTGEVLDVDGTCGGYNLHFAWASAYLVSNTINERG